MKERQHWLTGKESDPLSLSLQGPNPLIIEVLSLSPPQVVGRVAKTADDAETSSIGDGGGELGAGGDVLNKGAKG